MGGKSSLEIAGKRSVLVLPARGNFEKAVGEIDVEEYRLRQD